MDSLRKKVPARENTAPNRAPSRPAQIHPKPLPPKEELFISLEESRLMDKHLDVHEEKFQQGKKLSKLLKIILITLLILAVTSTVYFFWKGYQINKRINPTSEKNFAREIIATTTSAISKNRTVLKGEESGRINILLLGAAGEKKPGGNLTDTVMIFSINTKNKRVGLLSLPRDFYVPIGNSTTYAKINSLYPIGIKESKGIEYVQGAVEKTTGLKMNYHAVVDFESFEKIIDHIGGINIVNERDIYDPTYPGPNYSYEIFSLSKGFHNLDGKTALKYVRERHADPEGDFGRAKRQQQVIKAVKNKLFSVKTFFNVIALNNILDTLGNGVKTDINLSELESFIELSQLLDLENVENVVIDAWKKESLLKVSHVSTSNGNAFILIPRVGNYSEIHELAKNLFNQEEIKKRKEAIKSEKASIVLINKSSDPQLASKVKEVLTNKLDMENVNVLNNESGDLSDSTTVVQKNGNNKLFTLDEIIKKIPAELSDLNLAEDDENDFVVNIGNNLTEIYNYEEDKISQEEFNNNQKDNNF